MDEYSLKCKQFLLETGRYKTSDRIRVFAYYDIIYPNYIQMEVRKMFHKGLGSPVISIPKKEIDYWETYKMRNEKITKIINKIKIKL